MSAELTDKQAQFVREYLVDLNATQAAIRCGYSEKTAYSQGQRLLKKAEIAAAVQRAMDERATRTEITADRVLMEFAKLGFSDIRKAVRWGGASAGSPDTDVAISPAPSFVEPVNSDEIDDETAAAVAEVSQTAQGLKVKMHDKLGALTQLGRHLGLFTDKLEHSGSVEVKGGGVSGLLAAVTNGADGERAPGADEG